MMNWIEKYVRNINALNEYIGRAVAWLTTILVLIVCLDVFLRYAFNISSAFFSELEWHLFALIFLLGAGYALKHEKHVRVDVLYARFSPQHKAMVNLFGTLILLFPFCIVCFYSSLPYIESAYTMHESSPDPGGLPMRYLIKSAIPTGLFLLFLQGTALVGNSILIIFGRKE